MKFLIKYASRGRRQLFLQRMENIQKTISKDARYVIVASIDEDDLTMRNLPAFNKTYICAGKSQNKIEAINANMDLVGDWDVLINFSDDMLFVVDNWDEILKVILKTRWPDGDFFAHLNDGYLGNRLPTMSIMDKKYYDRDKYIYHPSYKTESCDAEAMYVAMMRGRYEYFPIVLFRHEHPCNNGGVTDETYQRNGVYAKADHVNYFNRMKIYFGITERLCVPFQKELDRL